jgi:hypothetical protein
MYLILRLDADYTVAHHQMRDRGQDIAVGYAPEPAGAAREGRPLDDVVELAPGLRPKVAHFLDICMATVLKAGRKVQQRFSLDAGADSRGRIGGRRPVADQVVSRVNLAPGDQSGCQRELNARKRLF